MKLREKFTIWGVREVVSLPDLGHQRSVISGTHLGHTIVSRVCRKTYGVCVNSTSRTGDRENFKVIDEAGDALCENAFHTFARNEDSIPVAYSVTREVSVWVNPCGR